MIYTPSLRGVSPAPAPSPEPYHESASIVFDQILTAKQAVPGAAVNIDTQGAFQLEALAGTQTGAYTIRLRLPDGRSYPSNAPASNANLIGTGVFPAQFPVPVIYPAGSQIQIDITDTSNAGNTVQIVFLGKRIFGTY